MKKVLLSTLLFAMPASAALKYPAEIGPEVGYLWIEGDSDVENGLLYGARFTTFLGEDVSAELSVLAGEFDLKDNGKDADILLPTLQVQKHYGHGKWRPYISGGAGYLEINRDRRVKDNDIDFAVIYGAGAKYQLHPSFLARFDARHLIDTESGIGTNSALFSVGLSWIYGQEGPKPAVVAAPPPPPVQAEPVPEPVAPPAPEPAPAPVPLAVPEKEWVLTGVQFESGSARIRKDSMASLENALEILSANPNMRVEIQGNTDRTGSAEVNVKLSQDRADAVKNFLVERGIAEDRLQTRGLGFTNPVASNKTPEGRAKNRRIEFRILSR